jgi:hypothetical protein
MSIITLFTKTSPVLAGLSFDAILQNTVEVSTTWTQYPIESGAHAVDHGILLPFKYSLTGAVSNNPLRVSATDFTGALTDIFDLGGINSGLVGLGVGLLSGSDSTRSAEAFTYLINVQAARIPFDVFAGDITLTNMVISNITRTKDPENESALIFRAELQELTNIDRLLSTRDLPEQFQLRNESVEKSQISRLIEKGQKAINDASKSVQDRIGSIFQ